MIPTGAFITFLSELTAVGAALTTAKLSLFVNSPPIFIANPLPGAFVAPTYTGYVAAAAVTFGSPYINPSLQGEISGGSFAFSCTGSGAPNIITGAFLTNTGDTAVLGVDVFATPITIENLYDGFNYVCRMILAGM